MRLFSTISQILGLSFVVMTFTGCSASDGQNRSSQPSVAVSVQEVQLCSTDQQISYSGTIEEVLTVPLSFSVLGTVAEVRVQEGESVHKGQLLATLNTESWQNSYDIVQAKEQQAEDAYRRMQPMHESGSLSPIKWVEVETGLQQAKAAAAVAKKSLDDCKLFASVDGIVGRRTIEPGMGVASALSAITLVRIDTVYARISVSESEIATIRKEMQADVTIRSLGETVFHGQVEQIGVMADPLVHTYKVKIAIPNPYHALLPGMLCNVWLADPSHRVGVVVPTGCLIVDESGKHYLFVADTTRRIAERREVVPGSFIKTGVEIRSGLKMGERIVIAGQQKLSDQTPITFN